MQDVKSERKYYKVALEDLADINPTLPFEEKTVFIFTPHEE
jgi:hypothetical protein